MGIKRHKPEDIITKLRQVEVLWAIRILRHISPTVVQPSAFFSAKAICSLLDRFFGIGTILLLPEMYPKFRTQFGPVSGVKTKQSEVELTISSLIDH